MPSSSSYYESDLDFLRAAPAERYDAGRARREAVPIEAHVEAAPSTRQVNVLSKGSG